MKTLLQALIAVCLLLDVTLDAEAYDGSRKGFILGGALGTGVTSYTEEYTVQRTSETGEPYDVTIKTDRKNEISLMTDFKIGYAPTEQMELYYCSKLSWFGKDFATFVNGLNSAGLSYYFRPKTPSLYLSGGLGLAVLADPFDNDPDTWTGFGFFAGAGYEFTSHLAVEFDLMYSQPEEGGDVFKGIVPRVVFVATAF
ncbi:MAG: hypothetical protein A2142_01330 [candidate division Zixibacteria bacterium RBG_16_48_11]|nr:MAG: hypothetical protein A2142_01330 [candidate division Zixibacteria bacterium RBG_16_48_11]